jgi:3-methyladenine DNA glycosylase AlkD
MPQDKLIAELREFCAANADPAVVAKYQHYFKEGYEAYGLPRGAFEAKSKELIATYNDELGLEGFLDAGDVLVRSGKFEEGSFAIVSSLAFKKQFEPRHLQRFSGWLDDGIRNWAHDDYLCGDILGYMLAKGIVALEDMSDWRTAESKWKRRAVPVSMLALLKSVGDVVPLLEFIHPMMHDSERVVHQGLGWFLREAWKRHPEMVEAFLLGFKDTAPRLIFQYATEKMTAEQKARFRKTKA